MRYDSNLCLYLQEGLTPLRHQSGLLRFPVFWEDDDHWAQTGGNWTVSEFLDAFLTPGLKIIAVHPLHVYLNTPDGDTFASVKAEAYASLGGDERRSLRHEGAGTRTILIELLERLTEMGHRFHSLAELYTAFSDRPKLNSATAAPGRETPITADDYQRYQSSDNETRQKMLRDIYEARDPLDSYATSRDFNLRELEIAAIKRWLGSGPRVLDLGCGNAYTLLSIGKEVAGRELVGVDFSDNLVDEASALIEEAFDELQSVPRVLCQDAWTYLANSPDASVDCVITERFLQNLPNWEAQKGMLREIERVLAPDGRILMCEGSQDGFRKLNDLREACGLSKIPETSVDNLSSNRFVDDEIETFVAKDMGLRLCAKEGVSEYFLISRVLHPILVAPMKPRFDARINELARRIQSALPFQPGLGTNVLWVFEKSGHETAGSRTGSRR